MTERVYACACAYSRSCACVDGGGGGGTRERAHTQITGERLLYMSDSFAAGMEGLTNAETAAIEPMLCAAAGANNSAQYRHRWRAGDVVVYDNLALQHFAVADYFPRTRRMLHASREGTRRFME